MRFYEVSNGCSGRFIPWEGEYQDVHAMRSLQRLFIIPVKINGYIVRALIETGAVRTSLSQTAFEKTHLTESQFTGKVIKFDGIDGSPIIEKQYHLDKLQVGRSEFRDVAAYVQPESYGEFDMLLGMDFMKWRKVWLSYKTEQVFMQYPEKKK